MTTYKVFLTDSTSVTVIADDCEVSDADTNYPWYNFWLDKEEDKHPTIAIFPYVYVIRVESL